MVTDGIETTHGTAIVIVEVKKRNAWEVAEEIRVILGVRAKVIEL